MTERGKLDLGSRFVQGEIEDGVLTVRIDRTDKRNAMTQEMYRGVKRAAILADDTPEVDVLCLTGAGRSFCVGGDMSGLSEDPEGLATELDPTDHFPFRHLQRCGKAVIAGVNGTCHAGGLNLLLYSDMAIASDRATFRAPELLRGMPDPWIAARLPSHVGIGVAKYLLYTGEEFTAEQALNYGLVGRVVPHDGFDRALDEVCRSVRKSAPKARGMVKEEIDRGLREVNIRVFKNAIMSPEMVEGMTAFLEKRDPRWPRE